MFTYNAKEISSELFTFFKVDEETGSVSEMFGWSNLDDDCLREALYLGIANKLNRHKQNLASDVTDDLMTMILHIVKIRKPIGTPVKKLNSANAFIARLENLKVRLKEATDLPKEERSQFVRRSRVSDALLEECRKYIHVSLLDMDKQYDLETPLIRWREDRTVYFVEPDFTVTAWRVGIAGYTNIFSFNKIVTVKLSYLVHNMDADNTRHQAVYNKETGNFERHWNTYHHGEYTPGMEMYHANLDDAIADAEQKIKEQTEKRETALQMAKEQRAKLAA